MATKHEVRLSVWTQLTEQKLARFPFPTRGRIPNFKGAEQAADRLADHPCFKNARTLKCNPDAPQLPVRLRALQAGKTVFMAVPRLARSQCFIRLDPASLDPRQWKKAVTLSGFARLGQPVSPSEMSGIDLIVAGSVAVKKNGARCGKGGGYSDLEFAIGQNLNLVTKDTTIVTTVHDEQIVQARWKVEPHDIPLDFIFTPTTTLTCAQPHPRPEGILWDRLDPAMRRDIPILDQLDPDFQN